MTSFSSDGILGISPEYRQSRIISGCPITAEEEAAIAECRQIYDDPQYRQDTAADPLANWVPYWEACRRLEKLRRPAMQAAIDQRRADDGVPVTEQESAARARVAEIEDTAALPRSAETRAALEQATAAWWAAEREAYEIAGVELLHRRGGTDAPRICVDETRDAYCAIYAAYYAITPPGSEVVEEP